MIDFAMTLISSCTKHAAFLILPLITVPGGIAGGEFKPPSLLVTTPGWPIAAAGLMFIAPGI